MREKILELSHAAEILKHDADSIDITGADIHIGRVRAVRKRTHEQTVVTGRQRVKGKSTEAVGDCGSVRSVWRVAWNGGKNRIVRKRAAGIREGADYSSKAVPG